MAHVLVHGITLLTAECRAPGWWGGVGDERHWSRWRTRESEMASRHDRIGVSSSV